jgi:excisionase family DNA binding protein
MGTPFMERRPMPAEFQPIALSPRDAAQFLSISKRTLSRLIRAGKVEARKAGPRTLVDVASLKAYYASLPQKTDHAPIVFGRRAHVLPRSRAQARH